MRVSAAGAAVRQVLQSAGAVLCPASRTLCSPASVAVAPSGTLAPERKIVVGLDSGNTCTRAAYALVSTNQSDASGAFLLGTPCPAWPDQPEHNPYSNANSQARTALLYQGSQPVAWGWSALKDQPALGAADGKLLLDGQARHVLQHFKVALAGDAAYNQFLLPAGFSGVQVAAEYLACVRRHLMPHLSRALRAPASAADVQWCLTVPALWNDEAREQLRRAAQQAELVPTPHSDGLLLVSDPQAAALHAARVGAGGGELCGGDVVLVVDAGGTTVSATLHRAVARAGKVVLSEAVMGASAVCGSAAVDESWEQHCRAFMGAEVYDAWHARHPDERLELQAAWEAVKCGVDSSDAAAPSWSASTADDAQCDELEPRASVADVLLPRGLRKGMPRGRVEALRRASGDGRTSVPLHAGTLRNLFDPTVRQVVHLARQQVRRGWWEGLTCTKVLLVGGFAQSPYLQRCVRDEFRSWHGFEDPQVIVPYYPAAAAVQGAVLFGCGPQLRGSRVSRFSYGPPLCAPAAQHPGRASRWWDPTEQCYLVNDVFSPLVRRGQLVAVGHTMTYNLFPVDASARSLAVKLFATASPTAAYTGDASMKQVCSLDVPLPSGWCSNSNQLTARGGYSVKVVLHFGVAEVAVTATDQQTGSMVEARFDFEQEEP